MPATAARIAFITQQFRVVTSGPDAVVAAKYGYAARDTDEPIESYFDDVADAQAISDARLALLKPDRRRLQHTIATAKIAAGLAYKGATPAANVIDDTRLIDAVGAICQFAMDFEKDQSVLITWG